MTAAGQRPTESTRETSRELTRRMRAIDTPLRAVRAVQRLAAQISDVIGGVRWRRTPVTSTSRTPRVTSASAATGRRPGDMLFIHEPAPGLDRLALRPGQPAVVVFSADQRDLPQVIGCQLVRCADLSLAMEYALATSTGQIGPGYAVIDTAGQLRYLTHHPAPGEHSAQIQMLIDALPDAG
ncbi:MAG: hypothetical protein ACRDS0_30765 [Pseudonocardiaceae bacterium]